MPRRLLLWHRRRVTLRVFGGQLQLLVAWCPGEWWVGTRSDGPMDARVLGFFGAWLIVPNECWQRGRS